LAQAAQAVGIPVTPNGIPNGRKKGDEALIHALAVGVSVPAAAGHAGLSKRTAYRRLEDPAFRARVDEARAEIVSGVVGRLSGIGVLAGDTLKDLLGDASSSIRLGAARAALEFMFRGHEQDTLARQLRELKQQIEALQGPTANAAAVPGEPPGSPAPETSHAQSDAGPGPETCSGSQARDGPAAGAARSEDGGTPPVDTAAGAADAGLPDAG
jgi:hypothetical protein